MWVVLRCAGILRYNSITKLQMTATAIQKSAKAEKAKYAKKMAGPTFIEYRNEVGPTPDHA